MSIKQAIEALEDYVTTIATAGGGDRQLFMAAIRQADEKARAALAQLREPIEPIGEREQFEAWARKEGYEVDSRKEDGRYWSSHTHGVWKSWQAALAALRSMPAEPYAYAVYFPDQPTEELVHDLDELLDDMTNREHTITELFATTPTAPKVVSSNLPVVSKAVLSDASRVLEPYLGKDVPNKEVVLLDDLRAIERAVREEKP